MKILFLSHCVPYPPNKGDRVRAHYLIQSLSKNHSIHLHALSKDPINSGAKEELEKYCASVELYELSKFHSYRFALANLFSSRPLTFGYFYSEILQDRLKQQFSENQFDLILVYCSVMVSYIPDELQTPVVVDIVDVDSEKWREYAEVSRLPQKLLYLLEYRRLRAWEVLIQRNFDLTVVCSETEKNKLREIAPEYSEKVLVIRNGIDELKFRAITNRTREPILLYVGQMNYLPNVDAVIFFYTSIFPLIRQRIPDVKFLVVGRDPAPIIKETCKDAIITGEVEDIHHFFQKAAVFVAPLRLAYGIQNKVLEAMACKIPVVATPQVQLGLCAMPGRDLLVADSPSRFAESVIELLKHPERADEIAEGAHAFIRERHDWSKNVSELDRLIPMLVGSEKS